VASTAMLGPTILSDVLPEGTLAKTEFFGAVLGMIHVETVEAAIELVNRSAFGNMACVFTSSGAAACTFRYEAEAGNIGISIGVAAPMAAFPFSGWKESLFGTLHGQARPRVLHTDEGRCGALAEGMVQTALRGADRRERSAVHGMKARGSQEQVADDAYRGLPAEAVGWRLPESLMARAEPTACTRKVRGRRGRYPRKKA